MSAMKDQKQTKEAQVASFVEQKIYQLHQSSDEAYVRASLAHLRRGIGASPGSIPELWSLTLEELPENLMSKTGVPTNAEWQFIRLCRYLLCTNKANQFVKTLYMKKAWAWEKPLLL